jgi:DNA-binding transcriptional MocR family regulator
VLRLLKPSRGGNTVRLSFSLVDEARIEDGIERLASLLKT